MVEWMGWSMEFFMNNYYGLVIFDICYKGERLVYENLLNDLLFLYLFLNFGVGLILIIFSDMVFCFGIFISIICGLDCFEYVIIFNVIIFSESRQKFFIREVICVYEVDG